MKRRSISKKTAKVMFVVLVIALASTLVSAGLLSYFGEVQTTIDVSQSVKIDGQNWDVPIEHEFDGTGGCCYCFEHTLTNDGCDGIWLDWIHEGPDLEGITVEIKEKCYLDSLLIEALDGIADDSFDVYVDGTLVYSYTNGIPINDPEVWSWHNIDLKPFMIPCFGTHTVKIDATGPAWAAWSTYGQLAINMIELYCTSPTGPTLCDSVDIGNPTSEVGHNLQDWGPIEPATSGGNWGGANDCRATWTSSDQYAWATVDLTCDFCECCCDKPVMDLPFYLDSGETKVICLCYELDMLIAPGTYSVSSYLVPSI